MPTHSIGRARDARCGILSTISCGCIVARSIAYYCHTGMMHDEVHYRYSPTPFELKSTRCRAHHDNDWGVLDEMPQEFGPGSTLLVIVQKCVFNVELLLSLCPSLYGYLQ